VWQRRIKRGAIRRNNVNKSTLHLPNERRATAIKKPESKL
jgi:hypothetical protein